MRFLRRLLLVVVTIIVVTVLIPVAGFSYGWLTTTTPSIPAVSNAAPDAEGQRLRAEYPGYQRPEESTFLTYPEWAIVYAAREYSAFVADDLPQRFPYWAYVGRFWQDYALMVRASERYPFNFQNHLMLVVIGTSHTVEHAVQWVYENTYGRLTTLAGAPVPQDRVLADYAADYAGFLDQTPWYAYPYADMRRVLWNAPSADGIAAIRSWERRLAFGAALSVKQGYADVIQSGLAATSDPALLDIHVRATGPVAAAIAGEPDTQLTLDMGANGAAFVTRRYQVFTDMVPRLIDRGLRFVEIGGNRLIFLTVTAPAAVAPPQGTTPVFDYPLPARPSTRRIGLVAEVARLHETLPALVAAGATLEHLYDY